MHIFKKSSVCLSTYKSCLSQRILTEFGIKDFYHSSTKLIFLEAALMLHIFRQDLTFVLTQVPLRKRVIKNVSNNTNFNK
jgi:hypothetical protein